MDWEETAENTITNENDSLDLNTNQHGTHHHQQHNQTSDILLSNDEFNKVNTQCIDPNLDLNLTQLNQLQYLNSQEDKIRNDNDDNLEHLILNQDGEGGNDIEVTVQVDNNNRVTPVTGSDENLIVDAIKASSASKAASTSIQLGNTNNTSNLFILSDPNSAESFNIVALNCICIPKKETQDQKIHSADSSNKDVSQPTSSVITIPKKLTINRYNFKCKYCPFITKFKAHTIEHMFKDHKINLMQCPELSCSKTFKDEWKLKRHLLSNRDHKPLPNFKNLSDVMKQYVEVTPQKLGFPCPLCRFDERNNLITHHSEHVFSINDLVGKNMDNYLFLDTYEHLKSHVLLNHSKFDLDSYFICKQCGQVFINRYKLSCHLFNVHSGKRKRRPTVASKLLANKNENRMILVNSNGQQQFITGQSLGNTEWNINETINNVISAQNKGSLQNFNQNTLNSSLKLQQKTKLPKAKFGGLAGAERKYLCIVCNRKFKRTRDLQIHIQIMHKNITEEEKLQIQQEIQKTNLILKTRQLNSLRQQNSNLTIHQHQIQMQQQAQLQQQQQHQQLLQAQNYNSNMNLNLTGDEKVCPICKKVFKNNTNPLNNNNNNNASSLNKSFTRHMQIQHGLNEKGERLIECPVCEKCFFKRQQLERHMHTHEIWVEMNGLNNMGNLTSSSNSSQANLENESKPIKKNAKFLSMPDFKDKHSILYCHECVECNLFFKSIKVLAKHKREKHNLRAVYKCANPNNDCIYNIFDNVNEFLEHSKIHLQKNIVCARCNIKFNNKNSLRNHMKNTHYNHKFNTGGSSLKQESTRNITSDTQALTNGLTIMPVQTVTLAAGSIPKLTKKNTTKKNANKREFKMREWPGMHMSIANIGVATLNNDLNDFDNLYGDSDQLIDDDEDSNSFSSFVHQQIQVRKLNCPTCNKEFPSRNSLHNHLATHNTNELKLFVCELCNNSFKTKKDLSKHAALHEFVKHKTCDQCGMTFKTSFHLKRHLLTRHTNLRPFNCDQCEMTFARKDKLKQHEAKHINHPLYQCYQCDKGFYRKEHLKDHEISKHSKAYPFTCENCNKGFVHAKDLHRHIRVRHLGITTDIDNNNTSSSNLNNNTNEKASSIMEFNKNQNARAITEFLLNNTNSNPQLNNVTTVNTSINNNNNNNMLFNVVNSNQAKQSNNKKSNNNRKNGVVLNVTNNTPQVTHIQIQQPIQPPPLPQPPQQQQQQQHQIISASSNDFKSKKISSILKSSIFLSSNSNSNTNTNVNANSNSINLVPSGSSKQNLASIQPNTAIYTQTFQLNPIQFAIDTNSISNHNNVNNNISIPIYNNSTLNEQFNNFSSNLNALAQTQNINIIDYNNQSAFNYNNVNSSINYNGLTLKQVQIDKPKESNELKKQNLSKKQQKQQTDTLNQLHEQVQSQTASIDNTIDSILNMISGGQNSSYNQNQNQNESSSTVNNINQNGSNQFKKSFKCTSCSKDFFYENHLRKHILSKHSQTPLYSCSVCSQGFSTRSTAKSHVENSHSNYSCPVCFKSFNNRSHAQRHIQNIHQKNNNSTEQSQNIVPVKQIKNDAKIIDLSSKNLNMLNTIEIKNSNTENKFTNENSSLNLNDINLNFVEPQNFSNIYWSSGTVASSSTFPSSTNFSLGQQQHLNLNTLYENNPKSDNSVLLVSNGLNQYFLSQ